MNSNPQSPYSSDKEELKLPSSPTSNIKFCNYFTGWYPLLLIMITFGVYFQSIFYEFTYDDKLVVLGNPKIRAGNWAGIFNPEGEVIFLRQVRTLTFAFDHAVFGFSPAGYHLHNILWHVLCVVLVFIFIKKLTGQATVSFLGSLIFAIHPIQVEAVSNITNRKEMLALSFLLIAFLSYIRFLEGNSPRKYGWLVIVSLSWVVAVFSKQVALMLPPLLVVYEFLLVPKEQRFLTKNIPVLLVLIGLGSSLIVLYAIYNLDMLNFEMSKALSFTLKGYQGDLTYHALVATSARAFWNYIQLLIWPRGLCPDHLVKLSTSFLESKALLAWLGLLAFIIIMFWISPRSPVLAFGMFWFFLSFVPISNWAPSTYILADRYMYMPSVGFCILLVLVSQNFFKWLHVSTPRWARSIATVLTAGVILGYTATTLAYLPTWSNQETIFSYMKRCSPDSPRGTNGLGTYYFDKGMYDKAMKYFTRAIAQGSFKAYTNRGNTFYEMGMYQAALKDYNSIISLKPDWHHPYSNRGILYYSLEKYDLALEDFNKALERDPTNSRYLNLRGLTYERLGDWKNAETDYTRAIASDPSNAEAYFNLGRVHLHNDELDTAVLNYKKAKDLGWEKADEVLRVLRKKGYLQ